MVSAPAVANPMDAVRPGSTAMSCRAIGMSGGGADTQVLYSSDCVAMHSLNVLRKGALAVPRGYGEIRTPIMGGGRVIGWEGGYGGGPIYESGTPPGNVPLALND
jgi:hypothetical protein